MPVKGLENIYVLFPTRVETMPLKKKFFLPVDDVFFFNDTIAFALDTPVGTETQKGYPVIEITRISEGLTSEDYQLSFPKKKQAFIAESEKVLEEILEDRDRYLLFPITYSDLIADSAPKKSIVKTEKKSAESESLLNEKQKQLRKKRHELDQCVKLQEFERAAVLHNEILELEKECNNNPS